MRALMAEIAARTRFAVRPNLAEADAALAILRQTRGSRELARFTTRLEVATENKRQRVRKAARR
jgi:hypothetical protein